MGIYFRRIYCSYCGVHRNMSQHIISTSACFHTNVRICRDVRGFKTVFSVFPVASCRYQYGPLAHRWDGRAWHNWSAIEGRVLLLFAFSSDRATLLHLYHAHKHRVNLWSNDTKKKKRWKLFDRRVHSYSFKQPVLNISNRWSFALQCLVIAKAQ